MNTHKVKVYSARLLSGEIVYDAYLKKRVWLFFWKTISECRSAVPYSPAIFNWIYQYNIPDKNVIFL